MSHEYLPQQLAKDTRYFPCFVALLVLGLFLLFFKELNEELRKFFVPSLGIYIIGTSLIAWWQTELSKQQGGQVGWVEKKVVPWAHVGWFVFFVGYNIWRFLGQAC